MAKDKEIEFTECPRDAIQGIKDWIPTERKINYLRTLFSCGFPVVDAVSFVSPKAMPQMQDAHTIMEALHEEAPEDTLLAIVANQRGAEEALRWKKIAYLGFPLSVSETFQQRNTRKSIAQAEETVQAIARACDAKNRKLVVYLSMAFGNPYEEDYSPEQVMEQTKRLSRLGVHKVALSDTIGTADPEAIHTLFSMAQEFLPDIKMGLHLHSRPGEVGEKLEAGIQAGCRSFDGALQGFGGCPMAKDELVGNMATERMLRKADELGYAHGVDEGAMQAALKEAQALFSEFH